MTALWDGDFSLHIGQRKAGARHAVLHLLVPSSSDARVDAGRCSVMRAAARCACPSPRIGTPASIGGSRNRAATQLAGQNERPVLRRPAELDREGPAGERSSADKLGDMGDALCFTIRSSDGGDGWIMAQVEEVTGAISQGRTRAEARENVIDALRLMLKPEPGDIPGPDREALELPLAS